MMAILVRFSIRHPRVRLTCLSAHFLSSSMETVTIHFASRSRSSWRSGNGVSSTTRPSLLISLVQPTPSCGVCPTPTWTFTCGRAAALSNVMPDPSPTGLTEVPMRHGGPQTGTPVGCALCGSRCWGHLGLLGGLDFHIVKVHDLPPWYGIGTPLTTMGSSG